MHLLLLTLSLSSFVELGGACVRDHGDGVWYQEAFAPQVRLCSPSFALGLRYGSWSAGAAHLFTVKSRSRATVRDQDYDINAHRCLTNCTHPALFETKGSAYGAFVRHEWTFKHDVVVELGALVFTPRQTVYVSEWRANGDANQPPVSARYDNGHEWRITPSLGAGWRSGPVRVMARVYPWVKTGGDEVSADGKRFAGLTGLYNGPTATVTLSCDF
jgi:hypothetical protein